MLRHITVAATIATMLCAPAVLPGLAGLAGLAGLEGRGSAAPRGLAAEASAAEPTDVTVALDLGQALEAAETSSPLLRRARRSRDVVVSGRVRAGQIFPANPVVTGFLGDRNDTSASTPAAIGTEWGLRVEQMVEIAGQRGTRLTEVDRAIDSASALEHLARVETRARVRVFYIAALIALADTDYARKRETLGKSLYESATLRVKAGAASEVEQRLAAVERGRLTLDRMDSELALATAMHDLLLVIGMPAGTNLKLTTMLSRPAPPTVTLERALADARKQRAELRALEASSSQLDAAVVRLHREVVPSPTLFLDLHREQPGQFFIGAGVGLPLPFWRRNQGEVAQVRAEQRRTLEERALVEHEIGIEVAKLYRTALSKREEMELWEKDVIPAAEANVDLVNEGWRAGKFDLFRVIQVTREAGDSRRKLLEVLGMLWRASIELDRARGVL